MRAIDLVVRYLLLRASDPRPGRHASVETSNGCIIGHEASKAGNVIEYLGIPYAQPPIGDLRFASPKEFVPDEKSTFEAAKYVRTSCIMIVG